MPSSRAVSVVTTQTPIRVPGSRAGSDQRESAPVDVVVVADQRQAWHQGRDHEQRARHQRRLQQGGHRGCDEADAEPHGRLDGGPTRTAAAITAYVVGSTPTSCRGQVMVRAAGGAAGSAAGAASGSSGSGATCSRHHGLIARRRLQHVVAELRPVHPLACLDLGRVGARVAGSRSRRRPGTSRSRRSRCASPRGSGTPAARAVSVFELEAELVSTRRRTASAIGSPGAGWPQQLLVQTPAEGRLGQGPLGDEQPAGLVEDVAGERQVQRGVGVVHRRPWARCRWRCPSSSRRTTSSPRRATLMPASRAG